MGEVVTLRPEQWTVDDLARYLVEQRDLIERLVLVIVRTPDAETRGEPPAEIASVNATAAYYAWAGAWLLREALE